MAPSRLPPLEDASPKKEKHKHHHHHHHHKHKKGEENLHDKGHEKLKCRPKDHVGPGYNKNVKLMPLASDDEASPHGNDGDPKTTGDLVTTKSEANKWEDEFLEERMEIQKLDEAGKKENGMDHLLEHMNIVNDLYSAHTKKENAQELRKKQRGKSFIGGGKPKYKYEDMPPRAKPLAENLRASKAIKDLHYNPKKKGGRTSRVIKAKLSFARLQKVRPIKDRLHVDKTLPECEAIRFDANEQQKCCFCFNVNYQAYNDVGINDPLACACIHILQIKEPQLRGLFHEFEREHRAWCAVCVSRVRHV